MVTFEQRRGRRKLMSLAVTEGRKFQAEAIAHTKALEWEAA